MKICLAFVLMFFAMTGMPVRVLADDVNNNEIAERKALKQDIRALLEQGRFKELEDMAAEFRSQDSRFVAGWPKLDIFYQGIFCDKQTAHDIKTEQDYTNTFELMEKWSKEYPGSITERVAEAGTWLNYAWFARGNGYANTVSDEGWRLFNERVQKAYDLLNNAPGSNTGDDPARYTNLLLVGRAQSWDSGKFDQVFNEAIALNPTYWPNYEQKLVYLLPRWHGQEGEWQKFAEESTKLTPEKEGMTAYTRVLWAAYAFGELKSFEEAGVSWPNMKQGFLDIEKNFPGSARNMNYFALFAVMANDKETAAPLIEKIGDTPCLDAWDTREFYEHCRNIARSGGDFPKFLSSSKPGPSNSPFDPLIFGKYFVISACFVGGFIGIIYLLNKRMES